MIGKKEDNKQKNASVEKEIEASKDDKSAKNGVINQAFEKDEKLDENKKRIDSVIASNNMDLKEVDQSEIEIGFTKSMMCTSKL